MEILQNLGALPIYFLMFLILYFFMIRPQLKQTKLHNELISNLKKGDKIITRGGIYGKVDSFQGKNNSIVKLEINSNVTINVDRKHISTVIDSK